MITTCKPPRHPQINGLVERFNGRIADVLATTWLDSAASLEQTSSAMPGS